MKFVIRIEPIHFRIVNRIEYIKGINKCNSNLFMTNYVLGVMHTEKAQ